MKKNYDQIQYFRLIQRERCWVYQVISKRWIGQKRRFGASHLILLHKKMRSTITQTITVVGPVLENQAKNLMKNFMEEMCGLGAFTFLVRKFNRGFLYIQQKMRDQLSTKYSKVEVLISYWDKIFGKLQV